MSRIGRLPVEIPKGVSVDYSDQVVKVTGPNGTLERSIHEKIQLLIDEKEVRVDKAGEFKKARALQGLTRSLVNNMVVGVTQGFTKTLEIHGVGYRAEAKDQTLTLNLGFSQPVKFEVPESIEAKVNNLTQIVISGIDKELVGLTAARIRKIRPPDPYKGKGVRYHGEHIRRKVGKAGAK